ALRGRSRDLRGGGHGARCGDRPDRGDGRRGAGPAFGSGAARARETGDRDRRPLAAVRARARARDRSGDPRAPVARDVGPPDAAAVADRLLGRAWHLPRSGDRRPDRGSDPARRGRRPDRAPDAVPARGHRAPGLSGAVGYNRAPNPIESPDVAAPAGRDAAPRSPLDMISTGELKKGVAIELDGELWQILDY